MRDLFKLSNEVLGSFTTGYVIGVVVSTTIAVVALSAIAIVWSFTGNW